MAPLTCELWQDWSSVTFSDLWSHDCQRSLEQALPGRLSASPRGGGAAAFVVKERIRSCSTQQLHLLHWWWWRPYCFAKTILAAALSLAPHNPRASQIDPIQSPLERPKSNQMQISLPPPLPTCAVFNLLAIRYKEQNNTMIVRPQHHANAT